MDEAGYRLLMKLAILLTVGWVGWTLYDADLDPSEPGTGELAAGLRFLEDGRYQEALRTFDEAYRLAADKSGALRGKAQALTQIAATEMRQAMQQESAQARRTARAHYLAALANYDEAILLEQQRDPSDLRQRILGVAFANRGILKDHMGDYTGALADYERAMELEPEVKQGPGLLTRFLRNQSERPPTVADRAQYIRQQLTLPEAERLLRIPEEDARQRAFSMD